MYSPAIPPGLSEAARALSRQFRAHFDRFGRLIGPRAARLNGRLRGWLRLRGYSAAQSKALCAITPAALLGGRHAPERFFEQVAYSGRRLAKLNVPPGEIVAAVRHSEAILRRELPRAGARDFQAALWQVQGCILLALNHAFYQVRESEAQAFYELARAELQAADLKDLLRRTLRILQRFCRASAGRLVIFGRSGPNAAPVPHRGLSRPRYIRRSAGARTWILDPRLRRGHRCFWSVPLRADGKLAGVLQLAFEDEYRWLPRELELLQAAAERCLRAAERVELRTDLAGREEQVRRLGEHMRRIEEEERRRLSRELHDEAGQSLLCIRLQLELVGRLAPPALRARVDEVRELTERTIVEIRRIIAALSPAVLEQLGLAAALRQLAARFRTLYPARVRLEVARGLRRLSRETETTAYRLVQECFHNIAKHSRATAINISLRPADGQLRLQVADDGVGFDTARPPRRDALGLAGMKERVALLGGRMEIRSAPGRGTTVRVDLPMEPRTAKRVAAGREAKRKHYG